MGDIDRLKIALSVGGHPHRGQLLRVLIIEVAGRGVDDISPISVPVDRNHGRGLQSVSVSACRGGRRCRRLALLLELLGLFGRGGVGHFVAVLLDAVGAAGADAGDDGPEAAAEWLREESVQDGVHTGVAVGQHLGGDLNGNAERGEDVHVHGADNEDDVDGKPGESEDDDDDEDHLDDALLVPDALGGGPPAGRRVPQPMEHH